MTEVLTLGECLISFIATARGPLAEAETFQRTVAGAEANVAVGLARLGHQVAYLGRVGDDPFGTLIRRRLRGEGVDTRWLMDDPRGPTGLMIREQRELVPMSVIYHRSGSAASRLSPRDVEAAAGCFGGLRWLHATGITPAISETAAAAVSRAVDLAMDAGATVSLDLNIRRRLWTEAQAARVLRELAARCQVVLGGLDEAALVGGLATTLEAGAEADPIATAATLLRGDTTRVVLKLGAGGALEYTRDGGIVRSPALPVPTVVDPVGAGDAFTAGYIAASLDGASPTDRLRAGNACGAAVVVTSGDQTGLLTRRELDALLTAGSRPDTIR